MNLQFALRSLAAGLFALTLASSVPAAIVSYSFSGHFSLLGGTAPAALAGAGFEGTVSFDPAAPPIASTANSITYAFGSASLEVLTPLGSGASTPGSGDFGESWDFTVPTRLHGTIAPADQFGAGSNASFDVALSMFTAMSVQLVDDGSAPADDPLGAPLSAPPASLPLGAFEAAEFSMVGLTPTPAGGFLLTALAVGNLECLSPDADACRLNRELPAPATWMLVAGALALLGARCRR